MYNTSKIKCVLFDMDGTVLDSEGLFDAAQLRLLSDNKIIAKNEDLQEFKGMSNHDFYPSFKKKFSLDQDTTLLRNTLRGYLYEIMDGNLRYIDGFKEFYFSTIVKYNLKCGLVTNTTRRTFNKISQVVDIDKFFSTVITVTESTEPKPSPQPYIEAMMLLDSACEETIIIEDSRVGLISASKSGATVFGITTSLNPNEISQIGADIHVVKTYSQIKSFLI